MGISLTLLKDTLQGRECILASVICCDLANHTMLFQHLPQRFTSQLYTTQNSAEQSSLAFGAVSFNLKGVSLWSGQV